jgi:hypothetical protein
VGVWGGVGIVIGTAVPYLLMRNRSCEDLTNLLNQVNTEQNVTTCHIKLFVFLRFRCPGGAIDKQTGIAVPRHQIEIPAGLR